MKPYTSETLEAFGKEGVKKVQVLCPGFSADCLETLEEIAMENRDVYLEAGGEEYGYIPCLNDGEGHMTAISELVEQQLAGWGGQPDEGLGPGVLEERKRRAMLLGAGS